MSKKHPQAISHRADEQANEAARTQARLEQAEAQEQPKADHLSSLDDPQPEGDAKPATIEAAINQGKLPQSAQPMPGEAIPADIINETTRTHEDQTDLAKRTRKSDQDRWPWVNLNNGSVLAARYLADERILEVQVSSADADPKILRYGQIRPTLFDALIKAPDPAAYYEAHVKNMKLF